MYGAWLLTALATHAPDVLSTPLGENSCSPSTWKNGTCTNGAADVIETLSISSPRLCCNACATNGLCFTWTLNTRDTPTKCFLKGAMKKPVENPPLATDNLLENTDGVSRPPRRRRRRRGGRRGGFGQLIRPSGRPVSSTYADACYIHAVVVSKACWTRKLVHHGLFKGASATPARPAPASPVHPTIPDPSGCKERAVHASGRHAAIVGGLQLFARVAREEPHAQH